MNERRLSTVAGLFVTVVCAALMTLACGCTLAALGARAAGNTVKARYLLPRRPTVVLVHSPLDPAGQVIEPEAVSQLLEEQLRSLQLVPIVPSVKVLELRSSRPAEFARMSPAQIGRVVGADQVLEVRVTQASLGTVLGSDTYRGDIAAIVEVIDSAKSERLWPAPGEGATVVSFGTPVLRGGDDINDTTLRQALYVGLTDRIARLFYTHQE